MAAPPSGKHYTTKSTTAQIRENEALEADGRTSERLKNHFEHVEQAKEKTSGKDPVCGHLVIPDQTDLLIVYDVMVQKEKYICMNILSRFSSLFQHDPEQVVSASKTSER